MSRGAAGEGTQELRLGRQRDSCQTKTSHAYGAKLQQRLTWKRNLPRKPIIQCAGHACALHCWPHLSLRPPSQMTPPARGQQSRSRHVAPATLHLAAYALPRLRPRRSPPPALTPHRAPRPASGCRPRLHRGAAAPPGGGLPGQVWCFGSTTANRPAWPWQPATPVRVPLLRERLLAARAAALISRQGAGNPAGAGSACAAAPQHSHAVSHTWCHIPASTLTQKQRGRVLGSAAPLAHGAVI
mgnify:CR=1 FL=1